MWRDQNEDGIVQQTELQSIPGSPATPSEGFQRFALGGDARLHVGIPVIGELTLRTELVRAKNLARGVFVADPVASSRDLRELGWYVGGDAGADALGARRRPLRSRSIPTPTRRISGRLHWCPRTRVFRPGP